MAFEFFFFLLFWVSPFSNYFWLWFICPPYLGRMIPFPHSIFNIPYQRTEMKFSISNASGFQWRIGEFTIGRCVFFIYSRRLLIFCCVVSDGFYCLGFLKNRHKTTRLFFLLLLFLQHIYTILKVSFVLTLTTGDANCAL